KYSNFPEVYSAVQYILETVIHSIDPFARIPGSLNELRALYASLLERKRMLIHVGGLVREDAVSLLIPPPTCALLITTPLQLDLPEAYILRLEPLPAVDGEQLLLATSPGLGLLASELASLCWYSPQALGLCAALLMSESARELADRIREWTEQLSQSDNDEYRRKTLVEFLIQQNCERLDKNSQQIFYKLGVFAAGFTRAEAAAATGFLTQADNNPEALVPYLDSISHLKLLTFDEENRRYRMSDSVRNFAVSHLEESAETYTNLAHYYGELAEDCAMLANYGSDGLLLSLLLFDDFKPNFRQIWSWIEKHEPITPYLDGIILKLSKVIASFGRLRFIPTLK
ncbi:MAG: hypothetical protein ACWGQW_25875, partial [bacterium]